jgi:ethanolamine-phosphate phospho-lyase
MEYFNTYGGNPVSCAIANAVLYVIEKEGLRDKAAKVGNHLMNSMKQLMDKHPIIGDVRGVGLFVGIDLVRDRETREPATAEAQHVIARMKGEFILLSADGPYRNVLKMKPPMVFNQADADRVVTLLDEVLTELKQSELILPQESGTSTPMKEGSISPSERRKMVDDPMSDIPNGKRQKVNGDAISNENV